MYIISHCTVQQKLGIRVHYNTCTRTTVSPGCPRHPLRTARTAPSIPGRRNKPNHSPGHAHSATSRWIFNQRLSGNTSWTLTPYPHPNHQPPPPLNKTRTRRRNLDAASPGKQLQNAYHPANPATTMPATQ